MFKDIYMATDKNRFFDILAQLDQPDNHACVTVKVKLLNKTGQCISQSSNAFRVKGSVELTYPDKYYIPVQRDPAAVDTRHKPNGCFVTTIHTLPYIDLCLLPTASVKLQTQ